MITFEWRSARAMSRKNAKYSELGMIGTRETIRKYTEGNTVSIEQQNFMEIELQIRFRYENENGLRKAWRNSGAPRDTVGRHTLLTTRCGS